MGFPSDGSRAGNPIGRVAEHLLRYHPSHFMIWNLSEVVYDYTLFENQVMALSATNMLHSKSFKLLSLRSLNSDFLDILPLLSE